MGLGREQAMGERVIGRHIGDHHYQDEIRSGRYPIALSDRRLAGHQDFKSGQPLRILGIQRDFDDRAEVRAQCARRHDRNLALDDARFNQATDSAQASGRGGMHLVGQLEIVQRGIELKLREDSMIEFVELG
jgi:hypothetical protein